MIFIPGPDPYLRRSLPLTVAPGYSLVYPPLGQWYHAAEVLHDLLLATTNPGKIAEYRALLELLPMTITTLAQEGQDNVPEETGSTFEENALLKARYYASASGNLAMADDSGLEVDALNGDPGIYSARYAGAGASDAECVKKLLTNMQGIPLQQRTARFQCVIALVWPDQREATFYGSLEGHITLKPKGENGFGYDPVFYIAAMGKTSAELEPQVKNRLSHRGQAARKAVQRLLSETKASTTI